MLRISNDGCYLSDSNGWEVFIKDTSRTDTCTFRYRVDSSLFHACTGVGLDQGYWYNVRKSLKCEKCDTTPDQRLVNILKLRINECK